MALIQHLFWLLSLRQTHCEIQVNNTNIWFLEYNLFEELPHFAMVSYAFCNWFSAELSEKILAHILNKALKLRMVDLSTIFIGGTHIVVSADKKNYQKEQVDKNSKNL